MAIPNVLRGLEITEPTEPERSAVSKIAERYLKNEHRVLVSNGKRFHVVALAFQVLVSELNFFESPLPRELRPKLES